LQLNAITVLKNDHKRIKQLFRQYKQTGDRAYKQRETLVATMRTELSQHAAIEELVFYPQVRAEVPRAEDDVLESLEEHHIVKWTLDELEKMNPRNERYHAKVTVLMESVLHHIEEEEGTLFPEVSRRLDRRRLEQMGVELEQARTIAPKRPHPRAPSEPPGNVVAAAVSAPMDVALEGARRAVKRVVKR
jgi:hemerythrin superfamily protein